MSEEVTGRQWQETTLGSVCDIRIGGTPSRNEPRFWATNGVGHPWVSIADLGPKWVETTNEQITDSGVSGSNAKLFRKGTLLMSFKLTLGRVGYAGTDLYTNEAIAALIPRSREVSSAWLYHALPAITSGGIAEQAVKGQTLNKDKLERLSLLLPSPKEQRRIAEILDTADEAIQKTETLISKLKQVKAGLTDDLLTRGIDEKGGLRDPVVCPEQFKQSSLGPIPREWRTVTVNQVLADREHAMRSGPFGSALLKHELVSSGIPLLGIDNVHVEQFVDIYRRFVSYDKFLELRRYEVFAGDVLVTIMGTVGRSCVVPEHVPTAISSKHVWTLSLNPDLYIPSLLWTQINHASWVRQHFSRSGQGSTMDAISSATLRSMLLPVPPLDEQRRIAEILSAKDDRIRAEEAYRDKLKRLKEGLMEDLLTGWVRVGV